MFTVFGYLTRKDGLGRQAFIDYYENHHVPLILNLAPTPSVYKRHYLSRNDGCNIHEDALDFDVVTELGFPDRAAFLAWSAAVGTGPGGDQVAADEANFLDRSRTRSCVIDDRVTAS